MCEMISIVVVTLRQQRRIQAPASIERFLPSLAVSNDASPFEWSQNWSHVLANAANHSGNSTFRALLGLPWAQGVAGSNPVAPTTSRTNLHKLAVLTEHLTHSLQAFAVKTASRTEMRWISGPPEAAHHLTGRSPRTVRRAPAPRRDSRRRSVRKSTARGHRASANTPIAVRGDDRCGSARSRGRVRLWACP